LQHKAPQESDGILPFGDGFEEVLVMTGIGRTATASFTLSHTPMALRAATRIVNDECRITT
jgi:hypothetical protein